ncbi:UDP-glucose/GDP-mannose dehydrogenase dimerization [Fibrisoma limi BUZ 3]|uniref:UDP-glucose 6-dehydrogenase n=1 Tax=Fibrisoma limi BUZ 3 TaxID=1185876 RepID=I2GRL0_9BACT|nr:UDP-glucose/GDP-mannose dehydrogenase dimerization [Fibrisoma limi]CCH56538.1 UDP-glucose/GDP-mannose dehydrogenase dimerization [Fibrisoma limi BUZ 3]
MEHVIDNFPKIGIIGMGWVGKAYANNFKSRGLSPVCYSLDVEYIENRQNIEECDIVLIAVPTPTTSLGFDDSALKEAIKLVGKNKVAVIKSTVIPGTTNKLQKENPDVILIHSPEFLSTISAEYDAAFPKRNILGLPSESIEYVNAANLLLRILPFAPFNQICNAVEAEIIKYAHNCGGYLKIVFHNLLYDVCKNMGGEWGQIKTAIAADTDSLLAYLEPFHKNGRGAGGPCFLKDFSAFTKFYETIGDELGFEMLNLIEKKNISLLEKSGKDLDIIASVYLLNTT